MWHMWPEIQSCEATQLGGSSCSLPQQDLWKKIVETHVNEEKEEVTEEAKLEADPGTEGQELLDYHPCQAAPFPRARAATTEGRYW